MVDKAETYSGPVEGARAGIIEALGGAFAKPTPEQLVENAGYKLVTWAEFENADDVPAFVRQVAEGVHKRWGGDFVCYDPAGGDRGWLLIDDDRKLIIGETVEHLGRIAAEEAADEAAPAPAQASLF